MQSIQHPRHVVQDRAMIRTLQQAIEMSPMPRKRSAAARHSAGLLQQAIVALDPLTEPTTARPCDIAMDIAELMQQCLRKLETLHVDVTPLPKHIPKPQEPRKDRHALQYAGPGWSPEKVQNLRKKLERDAEMPYADITETATTKI